MMVELAGDEDALVRIEGIDIMTEYLTLIKKDHVEADYVPNVEKMFKVALDPISADEIRVRMAKLSGKILDKFSYFLLDMKYQDMFIEFYKAAIQDKLSEVRLGVAYNLPCFYFAFKNCEEAVRNYFD
jgi:hypothetical protein